MAEMKVSVLSKELIIPSSPAPCHLKTYKFSYLDQRIPPFFYPLVLCYPYDKSSNITQTDMTNKLKTSLSETLTHFYPLAGRLTEDRNAVDCLDQGVPFLVTQVESSLSDFLKNEESDNNKLVLMELTHVEEMYGIQVNLFNCGGIAVIIYINHRIGDACSSASVLRHWFDITISKLGSSETIKTRAAPLFDSAVLFPPTHNQKHPTFDLVRNNLVTKRFVFSSLAINKLKNELKSCNMVKPASKVEVVTALIWKCATMALRKKIVVSHTVNLRRKIVDSLEDDRFGNLFQLAIAVADDDHQTDQDIASLVENLRVSLRKIDSDYLKALTGENRIQIVDSCFEERQKYASQEDVIVFKFSSVCRLGFKQADFGWGNPVWVYFCGNDYNENGILFVESEAGDGIEAWITMNHDNMKTFEHNAELQQFVG